MERAEKCRPAEEFSEGVSQPSARELPLGGWSCANRSNGFGGKECTHFSRSGILAGSGENPGGKAQQVRRGGEQSWHGLPAAQHPGVFILHLALDSAPAEGRILLSGRNGGAQCRGRAEASGGHSGRSVISREVKRARSSPAHTSSALPRRMKPGSEYSACSPGAASRGSLRQASRSWSACFRCAEEFNVARQPRVVGQKVAQGDVAGGVGRIAALCECRQPARKRGFEIHAPPLDQQHGRGCGCNHFGEAGDVVNRLRDHGRRVCS